MVYDSFINNGFFLSEKIFPCNSHPCRSHATCIDGLSDPSNFTCKCPPWFTGKFCEGEFSDIPMGRFTLTVYLTSISLICVFGGNFEREIKKNWDPIFWCRYDFAIMQPIYYIFTLICRIKDLLFKKFSRFWATNSYHSF